MSSQPDKSDRERAKDLLVKLANEGARFTVGVSLELAAMLCHIAGGDGRGVYVIKHNPTGDQIPPPWPGLTRSHGYEIDVDGCHVMLNGRPIVFEEAMDVAEVFDQAIARATYNAVEGE